MYAVLAAWVLLVLGVSFVLGVGLFHLPEFIHQWFEGEKNLYYQELLAGKGVFPQFYYIRAVSWRLVFVVSVVWVVYQIISRFKPGLIALFNSTRTKLFILSLIFPVLLFLGIEEHYIQRDKLKSQEMFLGLNLPPAAEWIQRDTADERGMNFQKSDQQFCTDTFQHINRQGYFSTFNYEPAVIDSLKKAGKKIVFIIGDSFVAGTTSTTWNNTFCELLKSELDSSKIIICPFGVRGTDPLDYRLRADKFIPLLKPDMVLVAYCADNDWMGFHRTPLSNTPIYFSTNAGFGLLTNINNKYFLTTPDTMRNFYRSFCPQLSPSLSVRYLSRFSVFFATVYARLKYREKIQEMSHPLMLDSCTATYRNLKQIEITCSNLTIPFKIAVIPIKENPPHTREENVAKYKSAFQDLLPIVHFYSKGDITPKDYLENDNHFNDSGNAKFSNFLKPIILQTSKPSTSSVDLHVL